MQEPLVTISLREYQALKDLSDQFNSIRENAKYYQWVDEFMPGDGRQRIVEITQEELNTLFENLLNVDRVSTEVKEGVRPYGN